MASPSATCDGYQNIHERAETSSLIFRTHKVQLRRAAIKGLMTVFTIIHRH
jgi:hypothetical protein